MTIRRTLAALLLAGSGFALHACATAPDRQGETPAFQHLDDPSLENTIVVAPGVISGGQPEGDQAFDSLAAMGVRTLISVDGARPDVEAAEARGMRYIHLPIGYDSVPAERRLELARALRDAEGPVFMHCHHGVHRGPAAAAAGLATLGVITPDDGARFLTEAGTSPSYPGLFASVRASDAAAPETLAAVPGDFPSVAEVGGFVEAMAITDRAFEHLKLLAATGWKAPPEHPDLVGAAEAGILADSLRAARDDDAHPSDADLERRLVESVSLASRLEAMLVAGEHDAAAALLPAIEADCKACHRVHRNVR
ncbi:MAG: hypothetical protein ACF8QF_08150 [Phycisphaerales bacterium]